MSNIVKIRKSISTTNRQSNIVDVECIYETGNIQSGEKCVILKTYNPKSKKAGISQTLHITKETALELIKIFKNELDI